MGKDTNKTQKGSGFSEPFLNKARGCLFLTDFLLSVIIENRKLKNSIWKGE